MALGHIVLLSLAAFCGGFIQGLTGFGSTLVALPVLAMALDLKLATPICCLMAVAINIVLTGRLHGHIRWPALRLLILAALPGMALGARSLLVVPGDWLKLALAVAVLVFVAGAWLRGGSRRPGRLLGLAAGFVAGCMGAAIGVNGPPIVAWVSRQGYDRNAARATLTTFFLLAGIGVVASQAVAGLVTADVLRAFAVAVPALLLGLGAGMAGCGRIGEKGFARAVLVVLALSGTSLLVQGVTGLAAS
jgi:uncharacterized membrane protein YfcA